MDDLGSSYIQREGDSYFREAAAASASLETPEVGAEVMPGRRNQG